MRPENKNEAAARGAELMKTLCSAAPDFGAKECTPCINSARALAMTNFNFTRVTLHAIWKCG